MQTAKFQKSIRSFNFTLSSLWLEFKNGLKIFLHMKMQLGCKVIAWWNTPVDPILLVGCLVYYCYFLFPVFHTFTPFDSEKCSGKCTDQPLKWILQVISSNILVCRSVAIYYANWVLSNPTILAAIWVKWWSVKYLPLYEVTLLLNIFH